MIEAAEVIDKADADIDVGTSVVEAEAEAEEYLVGEGGAATIADT